VNSPIGKPKGGFELQVVNPLQAQHPHHPWSYRRLGLCRLALKPHTADNTPSSITPSPSPFPRYGHALPATTTASGDLYIFGGFVGEYARNDLYRYSTSENAGTRLQCGGDIPSPRVRHASSLFNSILIVWGGDTKIDGSSQEKGPHDGELYLLNLGACVFWTFGRFYLTRVKT
jgi:hypothetical protein